MRHRAKHWFQYARRFWLRLILLAAIIAALIVFFWPGKSIPSLSLSDMQNRITQHQVGKADIDPSKNTVVITLKDGHKYKVTYPSGDQYNAQLTGTLETNGVAVTVVTQGWVSKVLGFWPWVLCIIILWMPSLYSAWQEKRKSARELVVPPEERFADVGANKEVKEELQDWLSDLSKVEVRRRKESGVKLPGGVLLEGPPGTGKTMLARAVAGEAGAPFFPSSGPDLTAKYAGHSAAKIRELFEQAEAAAERAGRIAIVFIDEIDAIGSKRSSDTDSSAARDDNATLTQLLRCLDGFRSANVVLIAATNREETLDPALTRPGRLSRKILVPLPDRVGRIDIIELQLKKLGVLMEREQIEALAEITSGMAGSGIASLVDEAWRQFERRGRGVADGSEQGQIEWSDFRAAMLKERLGPVRQLDASEELMRSNSTRVAASAVVACVLTQVPSPYLICAETRGNASGATLIADPPEGSPKTIEQIRQRLVFLVSGRAAEKVFLNGEHTTASGADIKKATELALELVCTMDYDGHVPHDVDVESWRHDPQADTLINGVNHLLEEASARAKKIIELHRPHIKTLAQRLIDNGGVLEASDLTEYVDLQEGTIGTPQIGFSHRTANMS